MFSSVLFCVVICCSALQCVAVRCSELQCVAARCSALQCGEGTLAQHLTTVLRDESCLAVFSVDGGVNVT